MNLRFRSATSLILSLLLVACSNRRPPGESARGIGPLAERILSDRAADWVTIDVPGVDMRRGSDAEADGRAISGSVSAARHELLALLGGPQSSEATFRAHLFFVNSRDDTQRLAGRPLIGFIQQGEPTGVFVYTRGYHVAPLLRHELTHLYTFELWGTPRAGQWLVEGVGVWAAGKCQEHSADELAAGALARGALVPLRQLATAFRDLGEDVAMPQAGSIVGFLIRRGGLIAVQDLWKRERSPAEHPLGPDGAKSEDAWLDELAGVRPATLDVPRLLREGC
jgi:hypothetical protein